MWVTRPAGGSRRLWCLRGHNGGGGDDGGSDDGDGGGDDDGGDDGDGDDDGDVAIPIVSLMSLDVASFTSSLHRFF